MPDDGGKINDDIGLAEEKEAAEAEYLFPNEWDLTCYMVFKSFPTPT